MRMIQVQNNDGGVVNIITAAEERPKRKRWIRRYHLFGLWFAIANCRVQKRWGIENRLPSDKGRNDMREIKTKIYEKQGRCCPICGLYFEYKQMEAHHILPFARSRELSMKHRNIVMLCHHCHREVHLNPYLNLRMQEDVAQHFGIDLKQRYNGEADTAV